MKLKVGSVKVGSVKAANTLLNHLKFLFLGLKGSVFDETLIYEKMKKN
ncbi:hypothetical protein [Helicobacter pylori]|nr:hypothetical protein [Helicobacter pylori]